MSTEPYLSQITLFSFNFPPKGWAMCNGQTLPINQNQALFSLLGTTFGGNGQTTFLLPNLQGRTGIHMGQQPGGPNYVLGQSAGEENHTLIINEMASHNHTMLGSANTADQVNANGNLLAKGGTYALFSTSSTSTAMAANTLSNTGSSQGHPNLQPYLALNYCIALVGIFPSRN